MPRGEEAVVPDTRSGLRGCVPARLSCRVRVELVEFRDRPARRDGIVGEPDVEHGRADIREYIVGQMGAKIRAEVIRPQAPAPPFLEYAAWQRQSAPSASGGHIAL